MLRRSDPKRRGLSMTELMCVIAIIAILLAIAVPTILRAYKRIREFLGEL